MKVQIRDTEGFDIYTYETKILPVEAHELIIGMKLYEVCNVRHNLNVDSVLLTVVRLGEVVTKLHREEETKS